MSDRPLAVVEIFTDGACRGNPGPGGWGVLLRFGDREKVMSGAENPTTNNRMELMAAIQGLEALKRPCWVKLVTDSKYVQSGITEWLARWKRRSWKTANRQPVKNVDLSASEMLRILAQCEGNGSVLAKHCNNEAEYFRSAIWVGL